MALKELTDEQVRTMTLEQKDRWWLDNVFKGNMPQLTLRSALTGMILGSVLSLTNLYVGIRTGWQLGVGITSVILSFGMFKLLSKIGLGKEMTILENNAMQSIATSAGYMAGPLVTSIPAYMLVTGNVVPAMQVFWWSIAISLLGVLFAFPLKKRFINEEQLPFPEGYAAAVVMDGLHGGGEGGAKDGLFKAKVLGMGAAASSFIELWRNEKLMHTIRLGFLKLPDNWDDFVYKFFTPKILGTPLKDLTITWDTSIVMMATGGIMGTKTAISLFVGAVINYFLLAPMLIHSGIIAGAGFKSISMWSLWCGVAMMTTSSLYAFLSKPEMILQAFSGLSKKKGQKSKDVLADIELPIWVSLVGVPIVGIVMAWMAHSFFGVQYWMGLIAVPLVFVFTLIAVNSTGLTSITPVGALGKLTQLSYSVLAPGNIPTNIMTASITAEASSSASNLLMDIRPGYLLGAKPRQQALGHILGIFAGSWLSIPVFYMIFHGDLTLLTSDKLPLPSVQIWKSVAEVLSKGLSFLHPTAQLAVLIGAILGIVLEVIGQKTKGRFPISGTGLGLAFVLRFSDSFSMALGAFMFWVIGKLKDNPKTKIHQVFVENQETLSAGAIAGGSIIGILLILFETLG